MNNIPITEKPIATLSTMQGNIQAVLTLAEVLIQTTL